MKVVMQAHARDAASFGTVGEAVRLLRADGHISVWVKWPGMGANWVDLDDLLIEDETGKALGLDWYTTMQVEEVLQNG